MTRSAQLAPREEIHIMGTDPIAERGGCRRLVSQAVARTLLSANHPKASYGQVLLR